MSELPTPQWIFGERNAMISADQNADPGFGAETQDLRGGTPRVQRRLLIRHEVMWLLQLSDEKLQVLIDTRQITVIRISGEERFDSKDVDQLIDSYKATAARRAQ
jgi:hypothetical protein